MGLLIFFLLLALLISFICSIMEASLLSISSSFIETAVSENKQWAKKLHRLKNDDIDGALAAILSLNTIAHTIGAAGVGAQATAIFGEAYFGLISAVLTLLILVFSEIIPKTIGAIYWRTLAPMATYIIQAMIYIAYPLVWLSQKMTKLFAAKEAGSQVSREEVAALSSLGTREGVFEESENKIIHNLIALRSFKVKQIMTPRTVLLTANENMTVQDFYKDRANLHYSRVPVFSEDMDKITGYVLRLDIMDRLSKDEDTIKLKELIRPIVFCFENSSILLVLKKLLEKKEQIAVVVDEYGGVVGVVTVEDMIETLLGIEITDETDGSEDMRLVALEQWKKKAKKLNVDL